jgi:hypothetical protein
MKVLASLILAVLFVSSGIAQKDLAEPEFDNVFFELDAGKLIPLERQTAAIQGKASGFIVMSSKAASEFPGAKSTVRFRANQPLEFIVRSPIASTTVDPSTLYVLRRLNVKKKKSRELVIMAGHATPFGASTKTDLAEGVLPITFTHYGASSLRVTTGPLPPGEYALSQAYAQTVFCFGTD